MCCVSAESAAAEQLDLEFEGGAAGDDAAGAAVPVGQVCECRQFKAGLGSYGRLWAVLSGFERGLGLTTEIRGGLGVGCKWFWVGEVGAVRGGVWVVLGWARWRMGARLGF